MNKRFLVGLMALVFFHFQGFLCGEIPTLISPGNGAVLDNGCDDYSNKIVWDFDWSDVSGATKYHLYVIGNTAIYPIINNSSLSTSDFHYEDSAYIIGSNLYNWKWKVRAYVNGIWSDWSEERSFDVEPLNTDCIEIPTLISPVNGAVLDNGCYDHSNKIVWDFDWSDVSGATYYHLYVIGGIATIPLINNSSLSTSDFHFEDSGYIIGSNLYNWKWKVRAYVNGNWSDWSEERSFDVEPLNTDCIEIPTLISPVNGAVLDNGCSGSYNLILWDFDWSDVNGATKYHLYVIGNTSIYPVIDNSGLSSSNFHHESSGYIATKNLYNWKWKVRAYVNGNWSDWSEERSFDVEPLNTDCTGIPTLISPGSGAVLDNGCDDGSNKVVWDFDWSDVSGATYYHLYVIGGDATIPLINNSSLSTSHFHYEDSGYIINNNLYNWKWKVRAYVNGNWSDWSEERSFDVEPLNTDCTGIPTLISPANGAVLDNGCDDHSNKIVWDFDWSDVNGATKYHLNVIGNTAIYPIINNSSLNTSDFHYEDSGYIATENLYNWKWKVRAYVNGNWSDWSEERSFDVEPLDTDCTPAIIKLSKSYFNFGAIPSGPITLPQSFIISNSGGGSLSWSVTNSAGWLNCFPNTGSGSGTITISVNPTGLAKGTYIESITVSDPNASNSPQTVSVTLKVYGPGQTSVPFGPFATPLDGSTVNSSIPVTGWALDDIGVESVKIYRGNTGSLVYIGDAVFVEGARPDVEQTYPDYPMNYKAGWGYMMLTNFLPNGGNGTFKIHAIATDVEGHQVTLGTKTIYCDNANAEKPFGAIDTPTQGGTASGNIFINWGWVLTPQPNSIPTDGSSIKVWVDGINIGQPTYNNYRSDIAQLFPGYNNTDGAAGYFYIDTTAYENGVHTIQWTATDTGGNTDGIGSRYFTIQNFGGSTLQVSQSQNFTFNSQQIYNIPIDFNSPLRFRRGYDKKDDMKAIQQTDKGISLLKIRELERIELHLAENENFVNGFLFSGDRLLPLPIGSTLRNTSFCWMPGPGFLGDYIFQFIVKGQDGSFSKREVVIRIEPRIRVKK